jgi:CIC family chloride channel protein
LFLGAVAGCLFAQGVNYFGGSVIEVNFIIVGMAAILSASLHAPMTAAFIAMSITGSYELFIPIILTSVLSSLLAKRIFPFTVYSYSS